MTSYSKEDAETEQTKARALAEKIDGLDDQLRALSDANDHRDAIAALAANLRPLADTDEDREVLTTLDDAADYLRRLHDTLDHERSDGGIAINARDMLRSLAEDLVDTATDGDEYEKEMDDAKERADEAECEADLMRDLDEQGWDEHRMHDALRERGFLYAGETVADGIVRWLEDRPAVNLARPEWRVNGPGPTERRGRGGSRARGRA